MDIRLTRVKVRPRYMLTPEHGQPLGKVEQIGKGRFCTAYRSLAHTSVVYLVVKEEAGDYSKHILGDCTGSYFPELERLGDCGDRTVYRTRYYERLTAKHKHAWAEFKRLAAARETAWQEITRKQAKNNHNTPMHVFGVDVANRTIEIICEQGRLGAIGTNGAMIDALEQLVNSMSNYGSSYTFEFAARNLAVNDHGRLVLLDPVFDLETIAKDHAARLKRAQRHY